MCGRFTQTRDPANLIFRFGLDPQDFLFKPRYNIAPGQQVGVIVNDGGAKAAKWMQWGLVPSWAKDPSIGNRMINARAETITEKPSFKRLIPKKRCLVVADGFYEWRKEGKRKAPMRIVLKSRELFAFAGLWDRGRRPDAKDLDSFTIITTQANELLKPIHERMPVILNEEDEKVWLDPDLSDVGRLVSLLKPFPPELMDSYFVSLLVNSPRNGLPECIEEEG